MKRLKFLFVAFALAASSCCKPAHPFASRANHPPPAPAFRFPDVSLATPDAKPEGVTLSWNVTELEKEQNPKRGDPIPVIPPYYCKIERKEKGGDWVVLEQGMKIEKGNLNPKYIDRNTKPRTDYQYQVSVGSRDPALAKDFPGGLSYKTAGPVSVKTPGIWRFEFSNVTAGDPDFGPQPLLPTVWVKITKYDPEAGEVSWTRIHKEGRPLGFDENGTSVHGVYSEKKRRQLSVDFNCGGKIEKILFEKPISYEYQVCNAKPGPMGPLCAGPEKVKDVYKVNEIAYTDEDGKKQTYQSAPIGRNADEFCPTHSGSPAPAAENGTRRNAEVVKLLAEADVLWESSTVHHLKDAQRKYKKLLDTFGDHPVVRPRLAELAHRSKQKVE